MSIGQVIESAAMREVIAERDEARGLEPPETYFTTTVVIPCLNHTEYLPESLGSAVAQTVPPLEVIVVDDGSVEDVDASVAAIDHNGVPVRVLRVSNRGLPGARNAGLMIARGSGFLPLDADDRIEPTYLERTLPLLLEHDVVFVGLQEHGERHGTYMPGIELGLAGLTLDHERESNRLFYCSLMRTKLLREIGGYNGRMVYGYEDWDLWVDLMQRGARLASVDEVLFWYRTRSDGMLAETEAHYRDWNLDEMARHHGYERMPGRRPDRYAHSRRRTPRQR